MKMEMREFLIKNVALIYEILFLFSSKMNKYSC